MHGGRVYDYSRLHGHPVSSILDFSANINPLGPPLSVYRAVQGAWPLVQYYPDSEHRVVKDVLSKKFEIDIENIICGNGASEVLDLLFRALMPETTWIFDPSFAEYETAALRVGSLVKRLSLWEGTQLRLPLSNLEGSVRPGDVVVLNTPHNPTGRHFKKAEWISDVLTLADDKVHVVIDESFLDFYSMGHSDSSVQEASQHRYIHTIRSATKIFAIPGLRFGFAVVHPDLAKIIEEERDGWSVNVLAQAAATAAYQDDEFLLETRKWLVNAHEFLRSTWQCDRRIQVLPSDVNYFSVSFASKFVAERIQTELAKRGMYVRNCRSFKDFGEQFIRVALRSHADNQLLWDTVRSLLNDLT